MLPDLKNWTFERDVIEIPVLSPYHYWHDTITTAGYMIKIIDELVKQNGREIIESLRKDYVKTLEPYFWDNKLRFGYLLATGLK